MLGFLGIFGRSPDLRRLDQALRAVDLHPRLVPESVKLTTLRLMVEEEGGPPAPPAHAAAAELVGYCMLGADGFAAANGIELTHAVEDRLAAATESGRSLDARLVLLLIYARVIQPSVVAQFGLEAG
jgi:hypothetical protein